MEFMTQGYKAEASEPFTIKNGEDIRINMPLKQRLRKPDQPKLKLRLKLYLVIKRKNRAIRKEISIEQPVLIGKKTAITQKIKCRSKSKRGKRRKSREEWRGKMKLKVKIE